MCLPCGCRFVGGCDVEIGVVALESLVVAGVCQTVAFVLDIAAVLFAFAASPHAAALRRVMRVFC